MPFLIALLLATLPGHPDSTQIEQPHNAGASRNQQYSKQDSASTSVHREEGSPDTTAPPKDQSGKDAKSVWRTPEGITGIGTAALAIATLLIAIYNIVAVRHSKGLLETSREHADRLRESVEQMKAAEQRELRAYDSFLGTHFEMTPDRRRIDFAHATFRNSGKTPSHSTSARAGVYFVKVSLDEASLVDRPTHVIGTIGPGVDFSIPIPFEVINGNDWRDSWGEYHASKAKLYIRGVIEYRDAFGNAWQTEFCEEIRWTLGQHPRVVLVPGYNDAT